ncbi:MAG: fibronectin type III domain-containing protein, partial [Spirochaetota bacterium]
DFDYFRVLAAAEGYWDSSVSKETLEWVRPVSILKQPEKLSATAATDTTISLQWDAVKGGTGYYVLYMSPDASPLRDAVNGKQLALDDSPTKSPTTTLKVENLQPGTAYFFKVIAVAGLKENNSPAAKLPYYTNVAAPSAVSFGAVSSSSAVIHWQAPESTAGVTGYRISWGMSAAADSHTHDVSGSGTTSYTIQESAKLPSTGETLYAKVMALGKAPTKAAAGESPKDDKWPGAPDPLWNDWPHEGAGNSEWVNANVAPPTSVSFGTVLYNSALINWKAAAGTAVSGGYEVSWGSSARADSYTHTVNSTATKTYTISNTKQLPKAGTKLYVKVRVRAKATGGTHSEWVSPTAGGHIMPTAKQLSSPGNFVATTVTSSSVALSWAAVNAASGYRVWHSTTSGGFSGAGETLNGTTHTFGNLEPGTQYYFRVVAVGAGNKTDSGPRDLPQYTQVAAPRSVSFGAVSATSVPVSWQAPLKGTGVSGYEISWGTDSSADTHTHTADASARTYTIDANLPDTSASSQTLYVKVRANAANNNPSGWVNPSPASTTMPQKTKLKTPAPTAADDSGVVASSVKKAITVTWPAIPNAHSYFVFYAKAAADVNDTAISGWAADWQVGSNTAAKGRLTVYEDSKVKNPSVSIKNGGSPMLDAHTQYSIRVLAKTNDANSVDSDASTAITLTTPKIQLASPQPSATAQETSITLTWGAVDNAAGYKVWQNTSDSFTGSGTAVSSTSHTFSGLTASTTYYFKVVAVGSGNYSDSAAATLARDTTGRANVSVSTRAELVAAIKAVWSGYDKPTYNGSLGRNEYKDAFSGSLNHIQITATIDMSNLFKDRTNFNGDITGWDVSKVTDMEAMFNGASVFNRDISGWDISRVTDMYKMFQYATAFQQNLSKWDDSSLEDASVSNMTFLGSGMYFSRGKRGTWPPRFREKYNKKLN